MEHKRPFEINFQSNTPGPKRRNTEVDDHLMKVSNPTPEKPKRMEDVMSLRERSRLRREKERQEAGGQSPEGTPVTLYEWSVPDERLDSIAEILLKKEENE